MKIDKNEVIAIGTLSKDYTIKNEILETSILIKRKCKNRIEDDILIVYIDENIKDQYLKYCNLYFSELLDLKIRILGEIRTYNYEDEYGKHLKIVIYAKKLSLTNELDLCKVKLVGTICKTSTTRMTPLGSKILDFVIANNYNENEAAYIPCISWNAIAEKMETLKVKTKISILANLQARKYTKVINQSKMIKTAYECSVFGYKEI